MIFTRSWLEEFINLSGISDEAILDTLNAIGLETASYRKITVPKNVVVGKIVEYAKHPDADKLSICKVDNGKEIVDIVCGAKNVAKDAYVAVACIGATLPGGVTIKQAELRGVQSFGMLCSSSELGLGKLNEGIMILDESISQLRVGTELAAYPQIADSVFEIDITPNRGDCLSVRGVARELAAYNSLELRDVDMKRTKEGEQGIGRILSVHVQGKTSANVAFRVFETVDYPKEGVFLVAYRLALRGENEQTLYDRLRAYTAAAVGVTLFFIGEKAFTKNEEKIDIRMDIDADGYEEIRGTDNVISLGIAQDSQSKPSMHDETIILAATYIAPSAILCQSKKPYTKDDALFFRTSRGSEPDLALGLNYLGALMSELCGVTFYSGIVEDGKPLEREPIKVDINKINTIIGVCLDKNHIVTLLRKLYFTVTVNMEFDSCIVEIPGFRHDIENVYDLAEEILRIKGIDTIESKPSTLTESCRVNIFTKHYLALKERRLAAVSQGFFECVHFIFAERAVQEKFGFVNVARECDIVNPITSELDTLRTTLLLNMLASVSKNAKNSQEKIALFEAGTIFDAQRNEQESFAFIWSGACENDSMRNSGKPKKIDFSAFVSKIASTIGHFELASFNAAVGFLHPYQCAKIIQNGVSIGFIGRLHPDVETFFDIDTTFVCELESHAIAQQSTRAQEFSKFQRVVRDISFDMPTNVLYGDIARCITDANIQVIKDFYPVDKYLETKTAQKASLTVRFVLQALDKTLGEQEITETLSRVLTAVQDGLGIGMKQ